MFIRTYISRFYNGLKYELNQLRNAGNETKVIIGYIQPNKKQWFENLHVWCQFHCAANFIENPPIFIMVGLEESNNCSGMYCCEFKINDFFRQTEMNCFDVNRGKIEEFRTSCHPIGSMPCHGYTCIPNIILVPNLSLWSSGSSLVDGLKRLAEQEPNCLVIEDCENHTHGLMG